jgi:hypothetical protein
LYIIGVRQRYKIGRPEKGGGEKMEKMKWTKKECWEDNAGGLTIIWYRGKKAIAAAWGLQYQDDGGNGYYDMCEWDDYTDCQGSSMGWVDIETDAGDVTLQSIIDDVAKYEPQGNMALVATKTPSAPLKLHKDVMGSAAKGYFDKTKKKAAEGKECEK